MSRASRQPRQHGGFRADRSPEVYETEATIKTHADDCHFVMAEGRSVYCYGSLEQAERKAAELNTNRAQASS